MSHVYTQRGASLACVSLLAYVGEFKNALAAERLLGGPGASIPFGLPSFESVDTEEEDIFREWLVSHDTPFQTKKRVRYHFGPQASEDRFWSDWQTPFWFFIETLNRYALPQTKNTRRRQVVSHRV